MLNQQKPLPAVTFIGFYYVHSMFLTVQGEGPFSGDAAIFVRLEGCNIQCPGCDTDYTGGPRAARLTASQIVGEVGALRGTSVANLVVLTGGEPFRQDLADVVGKLMEAGYRVQIETNGTMAPSVDFKAMFAERFGVAIVVSPKAHYVDPWIANHAIAYKYVLSHDSIDPSDGLPVNVLGRQTKAVARPPAGIPHVFIQPADVPDDTHACHYNAKACVNSALAFGYRLQMQIHKTLGVE
jgi:organic radical activating enzyme